MHIDYKLPLRIVSTDFQFYDQCAGIWLQFVDYQFVQLVLYQAKGGHME